MRLKKDFSIINKICGLQIIIYGLLIIVFKMEVLVS